MIRLAFIDILRALGAWRWLAVPPAFFAAGWLGAENAGYDFVAQTPRRANLWDGPLAMMTGPSAIVFAFVLGFVLVTGDLYVRDRSSGTAAMTLLRSRSRIRWWAAKVCALGPLALVFSLAAFASALAASAIQLPVSLRWSRASQLPWGSESAIYPNFGAWPAPLFLLFVAVYTAVVLWAVGAIVLCVSAFYPRSITPLAAGFAWALAGTPLGIPLGAREGAGTLDPAYHLSYVVHFSNDRDFTAVPWAATFIIIVVSLALVIFAGAWRLRRADL